MAEGVGGSDIFGSGGHTWLWARRPIREKQLSTVGTGGVAVIHLNAGPRGVQIVGAKGAPAILKSGAVQDTKALADAALDTKEAAIETLIANGTVSSWEDDRANTGSYLKLTAYNRVGPRIYARPGGKWVVWQFYVAEGYTLDGAGGT